MLYYLIIHALLLLKIIRSYPKAAMRYETLICSFNNFNARLQNLKWRKFESSASCEEIAKKLRIARACGEGKAESL